MKTPKLSVFIFLVCLIFSACSKNNVIDDGLNPPAKKLKYLTQVIKTQGATTLVTTYVYDNKKRISSITSKENVTTYTYSIDRLSFIESISTNGIKEYTDFSYTDGVVSSVRFRTNEVPNAFGADVTYHYYRENGRITEAHYDNSVDKYTYDARGNVTKIFFGSINRNWFYNYDEKPSRFTNGFPKYAVNFNVQSLGPNNEISRPNLVTTYTYGTDGYPVSAKEVLNQGTPSQVITNYTYTYKEM